MEPRAGAGRGSRDRSLPHEVRALAGRAHLPAALLSLVAWFLEPIDSYLVLRLLGAPTPFATVRVVDGALSALRHAAIVPTGLGVQDVGDLALFAAYGVPAP